MTTYSSYIHLDDIDIMVLIGVLEELIKTSEEQIEKGKGNPYIARRNSAKNLLDQIYSNMSQMSGNTFFNDRLNTNPSDSKD